MFRYVLLLLVVSLNIVQNNSATFENVDIILTKRQEIYGDIDLRDPNWIAPKKKILIESDDHLGKYIGNETEFRVVDILNQTLPKLTTNSIDDLPNAIELKINWCGLKEIEPGTFQNIPQLGRINFNNNEIEVIRNGVFTGLSVKSIYLENNKISTIEDRAFNDMKLEYLHLYHNQISKWNSDWFNGSPVNTVFMGYNRIEELPENAFKFLPEEKLDSFEGFPEYPHWKKRHFDIADFSFNKIRKIATGAFNKIRSFEILNLGNNEIEELQKGVFYGIKYLAGLDLDNNKVSRVDDDIFEEDARIISIGLDNNKLSSFPLKPLKNNLMYIRIEDNPVSCRWIQEIENWTSNKTGDYYRQYATDYPVAWFEKVKSNCVN